MHQATANREKALAKFFPWKARVDRIYAAEKKQMQSEQNKWKNCIQSNYVSGRFGFCLLGTMTSDAMEP